MQYEKKTVKQWDLWWSWCICL